MFNFDRIAVLFCLAFVLPMTAAAADSVCFDCHKREGFSGKIIHEPLTKDQCTVCHNPHVAHYKGLLDQEVADLCYFCHTKQQKAFKQGMVHQPVRSGNCLVCHEAHASNRNGLLKDQLSAACFTCHKKLPQKFKYTHSPYAEGQCYSCHRPHQSEYGRLLKNDPDKVCTSCHKSEDLAKGHVNYPGHLEDCLSCHNPHGSDRKGMVRNVLHAPFAQGCKECHENGGKQGSTQSCLRCHAGVAAGMLTTHSHLTGKEENKCLSCHSPHAGDEKNLLKGSQLYVCRSCHIDTIARYEDKLYRHPEVKAGGCTGCHEIHGSNNLAMLRGDGNSICSRCHATQGKFTHPVGEKVRDIRTGQMVTCISCHLPMGSDYKYELIYSGSKDLCIQCHKRY